MKATKHYIIKEILFNNEKERDKIINEMLQEGWSINNKLHPLWFSFRKEVGEDK